MVLPTIAVNNIQAILFDINGTLRVREPHEPTQRAAIARFLELLEKEVAELKREIEQIEGKPK